METKAIRNLEPTLTPSQQQDELRLKASDIIANWSFPFARKVSVLVHKLAEQCVENAMLPNAPLNEGANTIGILEREIGPLLNSEEEIATILKCRLRAAFSFLRQERKTGILALWRDCPGTVS